MQGSEGAMRWIVTVLALGAQAATLPPPYPREGAIKVFDHSRVQVWDIAWLKQAYPLHHHVYDLVGVYYSPGDRVIISPTGERRLVTTDAWTTAFQRRGLTHTEEGVSDAPLRAVFVEIKDEPQPEASDASGVPPFPAGTGRPLVDNDRATLWEFVPAPATGAPPTGTGTMRSSSLLQRGSRRCHSRREARRTATKASRVPSASMCSRSNDR